MPYYHVTNKKVTAAFRRWQAQKYLQGLACDKVLKKLRVGEALLEDEGLLAVRLTTKYQKRRFSSDIWVPYDRAYSGAWAVRPRLRLKIAQPMRNLFATVPSVSSDQIHKALNFKPILKHGRYLQGLGMETLGKKIFVHVSEWAAPYVEFPEGVVEVTNKQLEEWRVKAAS